MAHWSLNIMSWNVKGLSQRDRWKKKLTYQYRLNQDAIILQERCFNKEQERSKTQWQSMWRGDNHVYCSKFLGGKRVKISAVQ